MTLPKWKERRLKAKAELEAAEQAARHRAFWEAVKPPRPSRAIFAVPPQPHEVPF